MLKMMEIAETNGINVEYHSFRKPVLGLYTHIPYMPPVIGLDTMLNANRRLQRCVMAEELGHHFTSSGERIAKRHYSTQDRLSIDKTEYKALRWAANYLIPENDLLDALKEGLYEVWELADHFEVTEDMMRFRMRLFGVR